ncbi:hypothetical protein KGF54_005367 [Candida jiufengensis]|uniref:uncharacterized protein n=1 Tax=Candida jiufengensis TaxID=497108 RepID=UPI0022254A5B|nr:uncharacterized protein KGF54_005367 [Candida jiufengensis]KAI5949890.1 hypothetical protein KGF54_005367 [Candida jiufengensis]
MTEELTSSALLEQLVYIDNYINGASSSNENNSSNATPNVDVDGQLSLDLAAFADDSFIFPDEDKPKLYDDEDDDNETDTNKRIGNQHNDLKNWDIHEFNTNYLMQNLKSEQNKNDEPISGSSNNNNGNHEDTKFIFKEQEFNNTKHEDNSTNFLNLTDLPKFPVPPGAKSSLVSAGLSQNQIDLLSALVAQHQNSLGKLIPKQEKEKEDEEDEEEEQPITDSFNNLPFTDSIPITPTLASLSTSTNYQSTRNQPQLHHQDSSSHFSQPIPAQQHLELSHHQSQHQPSNSHHLQQTPTSGTTPMSFINPPISSTTFSSIHNDNNISSNMFSNSNNLNNQSNTNNNLHHISSSSALSTSSTMSSPDAAELDKKRRNTAASARFRIKKKQKEQQMENKINNLQDLISNLENKLMNLEMENKLLRNLIIEKGSQKSDDELKKLKEKAKMGFN